MKLIKIDQAELKKTTIFSEEGSCLRGCIFEARILISKGYWSMADN
jgi:hypothetical protein